MRSVLVASTLVGALSALSTAPAPLRPTAPPRISPIVAASEFAAKHTSSVLGSLQPTLDMVEISYLDRNAQIVATLGPASQSKEMIERLIAAGVNVFRLNASHRRGGQFEEIVPIIRNAAAAANRKVAILGDIQGPKFRCSLTVDDKPVPIAANERVQLGLCVDDNDLTRPGRIALSPTVEQTALMRGLQPGMKLLLDDGFMEIVVESIKSTTEATCSVVVPGTLKSRKGINVPELQIDCSALTSKDREDAAYLVHIEPPIDYIALSFVQRKEDIQELIDLMDDEGIPQEKRPAIIPKIEKPAALRNIDEILAISDGIMVARGDLGVELGLQRVPFAQKFLIRKANAAGKFVITATQMMESMIENAVPTRAEVSDVANAVFDGTDAVMLSGESAMGVDPVNTVHWMGRVIAEAENHSEDVWPNF